MTLSATQEFLCLTAFVDRTEMQASITPHFRYKQFMLSSLL